MLATADRDVDIDYPVGDGKPVAESEIHFREIYTLIALLDRYFKDRDDVYVCGNNFIYFEKGVPSSCFSPDVYVVFGVPKIIRDCFKSWEEGGKVPSIVFELTSFSSRVEDEGSKKAKCAKVGVAEYILYDPRGDYLFPALKGFQLRRGVYVPMEPDAQGRLFSKTLNLYLRLNESGLIELIDPRTNKTLLRYTEYEMQLDDEIHARQDAETQAVLESKARKNAEGKARREAEARRIADERALAEAEARRIADERALAEAEARSSADQRALAEAEARRIADQRALAEAEARRSADECALAEGEARRSADARALAEAEARRDAELEIQRLRDELKRLKSG